MTKSHPLHRKKAIHRMFRRSARVKRLFWHISAIFERVAREKNLGAVKHDN